MISIAASKYFSVLVTEDGKVWTFGGGYNGELGHAASWQPQARPIEGFAAQVPPPSSLGLGNPRDPRALSRALPRIARPLFPARSEEASLDKLIPCHFQYEEGFSP